MNAFKEANGSTIKESSALLKIDCDADYLFDTESVAAYNLGKLMHNYQDSLKNPVNQPKNNGMHARIINT